MQIGAPFRNITGILTGNPVYTRPEENDRLEAMFQE
jgi:hypothetical protein